MKYYISDITKTLTSIAVAACLTACGGGGGGDGSNAQAAITGTTTGTVASGTSEATGTVTVTDSDAGQATFVQPTTLTGVYGAWAFVISGNTATWRYTLTTAPPTAVTETLSVRSQDGSAVQNITVSIAAGGGTSSALVTSVPAPVYSGTYAAEKVAIFNRLNDDRSRCGFGKLAQNSKLDLAAQNHADYHALNKIANTHYEAQGSPGYTGNTPAIRGTYAGYSYQMYFENLAQSVWGSWYTTSNPSDFSLSEPNAKVTLKTLYSSIYHMAGLMNNSTEVGVGISTFGYTQDGASNAKTLNINTAVPLGNTTGQLLGSNTIASFPCDGVTGLHPAFFGENPDPFPSVDRNANPYGHPIYVTSGPNTTITLSSGTVTLRGAAAVPTTTLTSSNDPQLRLQANQVFLVPTTRLADNATYDVSMSGTSTGLVSSSNPTGAWTKSFSFTTGTVLSE